MPVTHEEHDNIAKRRFNGGWIFIVPEHKGWGIYHEPASGGSYNVGWWIALANAKRLGKAIALKQKAKLYVEENLD
jgi:hypothetical protein